MEPDPIAPPPVPWTQPYLERRARILAQAMRDDDLLARLSARAPLPEGYGLGLDERCVEYPWLLAHLPSGHARVLDAGSTLNHALLLELPVLAEKQIHIVTLAPEPDCFWRQRVSYVFEDLRELPFKDNLYDVVVAVSTLEHVGCDNTFYTGNFSSTEQRLGDFVIAGRELSRVLKPGGLLLLTVPYGAYQYHGAFQQFDRQHLSAAEASFGPMTEVSEFFYRYSSAGWQMAADQECADSVYVEWVSALMRSQRWPDAPQCEPDYAAAARAVACVRMVKA
jgi:SAM-dependent methyltransferase